METKVLEKELDVNLFTLLEMTVATGDQLVPVRLLDQAVTEILTEILREASKVKDRAVSWLERACRILRKLYPIQAFV